MRKSEPNSESGNPSGPSAGEGHNPVSGRAAIAARARKNPKEQFNNLLHHLTYELVAECLKEIPLPVHRRWTVARRKAGLRKHWEFRPRHISDEAGNDRGAKGVAERGSGE